MKIQITKDVSKWYQLAQALFSLVECPGEEKKPRELPESTAPPSEPVVEVMQ